MSLYNMVCGNNPLYQLLHAVLSLRDPLPEIPRYRDTYTTRSESGEPQIVIYTRTGGGNREEYESENENLASHPLCVRNHDDDYDCTYAHFVFSVPEEWRERVGKLHDLFSTFEKGMTPRQKFESAMEALKGESSEKPQPSDADVAELSELVRSMAESLQPPVSQ